MAFLLGESSFNIANIKKGDRVKGVPNGHQDYGVFVTLAPGVSGLVPKGFISKDLSANAAEVLPIDVEQEFIVQRIDAKFPKPKITLSTTEFELGEGKAKPKQVEINYNEPIDNSKVTVDDGEKELCIVLPNANDEVKIKFLNSSIRAIEEESSFFFVLQFRNKSSIRQGRTPYREHFQVRFADSGLS